MFHINFSFIEIISTKIKFLIIIKERIFRFLHILTGFIRLYEDKKCGQFIHDRIRRKNLFCTPIKAYYINKRIFSLFLIF